MFRRLASIDTDSEFLLEVYTEARAEEMASFGWTKEQLAAYARMQFDLQQRAHLDRYPEAEQSVLILDGKRAGQIRISRSPDQMVLVDIGVVSSFRGRGIATRVITDLTVEAQSSRLPLRLCVRPESPAKRLYERLGFRSTGTDAAGELMLWDGHPLKPTIPDPE